MKEPALERLIEVLNANGPTKLKNKYFVGDPVIVPDSQLPMVFLSKDTTNISIGDSAHDLHRMPVVLNLVYAGAKDLNQKAFTQAGALAVYDLCEGRDDDFNLRLDTIAGVLRHFQALGPGDSLYIDIEGADTTIDYILSPPTRRGIFSVEAIIRTTLVSLQLRP